MFLPRMTFTATMGAASTVMTAVAYLVYFASIRKERGGSRPSRMTWLLLATIAWVVAINSWLATAGDTLAPLLMNAVGSSVVFALSISRGRGGWDMIDRVALAAALAVLAVSAVVNVPLVSLALALSFDFVALVPTVSKLTRTPGDEEATPWTLTVIANALNVAALEWSRPFDIQPAHLLPPLYFLMINGLILALIVMPRPKRS